MIGQDDIKKKSARGHLSVAGELILPRNLLELAKESNIAAGLAKKLGEDALWLLADSVYGIEDYDAATLFDDTAGVPIPVQYEELRRIEGLSDEVPGGQVAVFTIDPDMLREIEQYFSHAVYDRPEVAVRLGQAVSLLETYELNPRDLLWYQRGQRPILLRNQRLGIPVDHVDPN